VTIHRSRLAGESCAYGLGVCLRSQDPLSYRAPASPQRASLLAGRASLQSVAISGNCCLYYKGADQHTFERFDTEQLADDALHLKRFVFLLGAERVVPAEGRCHLYSLWDESQKVGRELTRDFYQRYADMRQSAFAELARDNPDAPRGEVLSATQKLLDRVLFCAFCEDRGLLPTETIRKAFEHRDPYRPHTIWDNFRGLFDSINRGNAALGIHAYNGGLFATRSSSTSRCMRSTSKRYPLDTKFSSSGRLLCRKRASRSSR
jgi:hypothetical protein